MSLEVPPPMPLGVSDGQAIVLCRSWMMHLGAVDAVEAVGGVRKTCDIYSRHYLAWVHNHRGNLQESSILQASRVAKADGRLALIFVRGGVFPEAQQQADSLGIAIFVYRAIDGSLEGANELGTWRRAQGLSN